MEEFDVLISGAGAAGLAAGLTLARALRSVLVFDGGHTRNAQAKHSHGILGLDGESPSTLNTTARSEVERFGGTIRPGTVINAAVDRADHFIVTTEEGQQIRCRQILVASGVRDDIPNVPGAHELWGDRVVICPYCDGWEARNSAIAVLGTGPKSVFQAQLLRQWSEQVTLYTNSTVSPSADDLGRLQRRNIRIIDGAVDAIRRNGDGVVLLVGDIPWEHDIVFTAPRPIPDNRILDALHAKMTPTAAGTFPRLDERGGTSVTGLWVAGNAANPSLKYSTALGAGMDTATHINEALTEADITATERGIFHEFTSHPYLKTTV
jgi:thioredoxin reductase